MSKSDDRYVTVSEVILVDCVFCLPNEKGLFSSTLKQVSYVFSFLQMKAKPEITFFIQSNKRLFQF